MDMVCLVLPPSGFTGKIMFLENRNGDLLASKCLEDMITDGYDKVADE